MTVRLTGPQALAEFLEYLAREVRAGIISRVSVEGTDQGTRVSVMFRDSLGEQPEVDDDGDRDHTPITIPGIRRPR